MNSRTLTGILSHVYSYGTLTSSSLTDGSYSVPISTFGDRLDQERTLA